jgi:hypothetical protein
MKKNKYFIFMFFAIFLIGILSSVSSSLYCCEKTTNNMNCLNVADESNCDNSFKVSPTYCESTSYCKTGTCINQNTGVCLSTPKSVCETEGGFWDSRNANEISQCQLGCCLSGGSASFTTQIACNRLARDYNLEVNFDASINDQQTCLMSANPQAQGACVYSSNNVKNCKFTTKKDCKDNYLNNTIYSNVSFNENSLCSNPELGTICAISKKTACKDGDVYFLDTCNNFANIYDSSKINDPEYWSWIQEPSCTDSNNLANKNSASCGDCDYLLGSICKEKKTGESVNYGDYICRDLDCSSYKGNNQMYGAYTGKFNYPQHGESWCGSETNDFAPGDSSYVLSCIQGEVILEQTDPTRSIICKSQLFEINGKEYTKAGPAKNNWENCAFYNETECKDTENFGYGDCQWLTGDGYNYSRDNETNVFMKNESSTGVCVPKYPIAGSLSGNSEVSSCELGNAVCYVKLKKPLLVEDKEENWKCDSNDPVSNCSCISNDGKEWVEQMNKICINFGDCGVKKNYNGVLGQYTNPITINRNISK